MDTKAMIDAVYEDPYAAASEGIVSELRKTLKLNKNAATWDFDVVLRQMEHESEFGSFADAVDVKRTEIERIARDLPDRNAVLSAFSIK